MTTLDDIAALLRENNALLKEAISMPLKAAALKMDMDYLASLPVDEIKRIQAAKMPRMKRRSKP